MDGQMDVETDFLLFIIQRGVDITGDRCVLSPQTDVEDPDAAIGMRRNGDRRRPEQYQHYARQKGSMESTDESFYNFQDLNP